MPTTSPVALETTLSHPCDSWLSPSSHTNFFFFSKDLRDIWKSSLNFFRSLVHFSAVFSLLSLTCIQKRIYTAQGGNKRGSHLTRSHKNNSLKEIKVEKLESVASAPLVWLQFCRKAEKNNQQTELHCSSLKMCTATGTLGMKSDTYLDVLSAPNSPSGESLRRSRRRQGGGWGRSGLSTVALCSPAAAPRPAGRRCQAETSSCCTGSWPWWPRSGWTHEWSAGWCERAVGKHKQKPTWRGGKCEKVKKREKQRGKPQTMYFCFSTSVQNIYCMVHNLLLFYCQI